MTVYIDIITDKVSMMQATKPWNKGHWEAGQEDTAKQPFCKGNLTKCPSWEEILVTYDADGAYFS